MTGSGLSATFGWAVSQDYELDRTAAGDARLAGVKYNYGSTENKFRIDLPSAGTWSIRLAAGNPTFVGAAKWQLLDSDGTTVLASQAYADTTFNELLDATGASHASPAAWLASNSAISVTFSGTTAYFNLQASTVESCCISHLSFESASGPTVTTVSSNSATEGSSIVHTVTLSAAVTGSAASYAITLAGGTATGGGTDYTSTLSNGMFSDSVTVSGGNISVPVGVSTFTVTVSTAGDTIDEANETYTLTIGGTAGTGTINDDDVQPTVTISDATEVAGTVTFVATLSAASGKTITFLASTADGTKTAGVDYTALTGSTVTFNPGETTKNIVVTAL